ncbi:MAG: hypothetical protein AAFP89_24495 [Bacteroidota bacterium]
MIVSREKREEVLRNAGVPQVFLEILKKVEKDEVLRFVIREPENFYFSIDYFYPRDNFLKDYHIAPIFEDEDGHNFYVFLFNEKEQKFAAFSLEENELNSDYGASFDLMLADLLIVLFQSSDDLSIQDWEVKGKEMGVEFAPRLFAQFISGHDFLDIYHELGMEDRRIFLEEMIKSN